MALRYRDKNGHLHSVSVFDLLGSQKKTRAQIEAAKKRAESRGLPAPSTEDDKPEAASTATSAPKPDEKAPKATPAATKDDAKDSPAPDDVDAMIKKEKELQEQLKALKQTKAEAFKKKKAGEAKPAEEPKKEEKAVAKPEEKPTKQDQKASKKLQKKADPDVPGAAAAENDNKGHQDPVDRANLTTFQCAQIMRLHDYYDNLKYDAIATKFYELYHVRISPTDMKAIVQAGYLYGGS